MKRKRFLILVLILFGSIVWLIPASPSVKAGEIEYKLDCTDIADLYTDYAVMDSTHTAFNKFNASELPAGYTVESATLYVMVQSVVGCDKWQIFYVANQTWEENDSYLLENTPRSNPANYTPTFVIQQWEMFDITSIMQINYEAGLNYFSVYIEHPDYPLDPGNYGNAAGTPWHIAIGISNQTNSCYHWVYYYSQHDVSPNKPEWFPYVSVVISTQPPYTGEQGHAFNVEIQPNSQVPTILSYQREQPTTNLWRGQWRGWHAAKENDASFTKLATGAVSSVTDRYFGWEWQGIGYPEALKQIVYDLEISSSGGITAHQLYVYDRNGVGQIVYDVGSTKTATGTWTDLNATYWLEGKIETYYYFNTDGSNTGYIVDIDQMVLEFDPITEIHIGERSWNGTEYIETITVQILQDDCNVTLTNVPENYDFIKSLPNCNYEIVGQQLKLINVPKGEYTFYFSTSLTRPNLVTIVLNYYSNITKEPLPPNTLNSSYVVAGTEYRIEPYTSRFVWDKDDGNVTIHSYDYFHRLLVNQSFEIPEDAVFFVLDIGLQLYKLTVHCNTIATLNITNSLNESYFPTFEISPENATLIKTLWLYGENLTVTTHSNDYGDITHQIDSSLTSFVNFKYRIPILAKGEYQVPSGQTALVKTIKLVGSALFIGIVGYIVQYYLRKYRVAEKVDRHLL